jgi:hypothetical protein
LNCCLISSGFVICTFDFCSRCSDCMFSTYICASTG